MKLRQAKKKKRHPTERFDPEFVYRVRRFLGPLRRYFRFRVWGLEHIPKRGPAIIVMNHGIIPYHAYLFHMYLVSKLKIYSRGLGASFLFDIPFINQLFLKGGAVDANEENALKLLREKNIVMLSPGGIYEALIAKKGLRRIPWERRQGFVRIAVKTRAPIIPTYCQGINSVYYNIYFLFNSRIKFLELTRFSLHFFFGLGLFPLPKRLTHIIGAPIPIKRKKGETRGQQIHRIHQEVIQSMSELAQKKVKHSATLPRGLFRRGST